MSRRQRLLALLCFCVAHASSAWAQPAADKVVIRSVEPSGPLAADVRVTFTVVVEVTVVSRAKAVVALGFNQSKPFNQDMNEERQVVAGTQTVRITAEATPRDWGRLTGFGAFVILRPEVTTGVFTPIATDMYHVPVQPKKLAVSADSLGSLDERAKVAALKDIASTVSDLETSEVVAVVHAALADRNRQVRLAAIEAIDGRTQAADLMRTKFVASPSRSTDGRREPPPPEWKDDGDSFRANFLPTLLTMARSDDEPIRVSAVSVINNMLKLQGPEAFTGEPAAVFAEIYANDSSADVRLQVVQALVYSPSSDKRLREVLKAAFSDPAHRVRMFASAALQRVHPAFEPHLRYDDVRDEISLGLADQQPAHRAAAVDAVAFVPQDARELLPVIRTMAESDPNAAIRKRAAEVLRSMK